VGDRFKVLRNYIHHNGINGVGGYRADDVLVEGNEVAHNNTSNTRLAPSLSTIAGIKVLMGHNFTARGNYVHHNNGKGIWTDHMLPNTLIEGNRVTDNTGPGIWHEVSYGAVIRNNYAGNNGLGGANWLEGAGIQVSNSPDVEIYGNTVEYNTNGITAMYAKGYPAGGPHGPRALRNLSVHDNVVRMRKGRVGIVTNVGSNAVFTSWNNRWENNTYYIGSLTAPFAWRNQNYTVAQWQAVPQDASGSFHR
jgi:parallel beta-helix repeat protein